MTNLVHLTNSTTFSAFAYGYNAVGNRTNRSETLGGSSWTDAYTYDGTDQVTNVNYSAGSRIVGYAYDAVGNRTSVVDNSQTTSYAVNGANQYTNITGASPVTNLTHSLNGNLTSGGGWTNLFDAQNRLVEVAASSPVEGSKKVTMAYDGRNRCVLRETYLWQSGSWTLSASTYLLYDGWNLIEERSSNGTLLQTYVHGPRVDEILLKVTGANAIYYHHDALGSVTSLTDANGVLVERYLYDIYGHPTILDSGGNVISGTGQTNRFLFTGREWLADVSLYDYRNRVYSALLGRFLQTDPIGFEAGDANIYRYCANRPGMLTDPMGLQIGMEYDYQTPIPPPDYTPNEMREAFDIATSGWFIRYQQLNLVNAGQRAQAEALEANLTYVGLLGTRQQISRPVDDWENSFDSHWLAAYHGAQILPAAFFATSNHTYRQWLESELDRQRSFLESLIVNERRMKAANPDRPPLYPTGPGGPWWQPRPTPY